jgi:hypothetical protein
MMMMMMMQEHTRATRVADATHQAFRSRSGTSCIAVLNFGSWLPGMHRLHAHAPPPRTDGRHNGGSENAQVSRANERTG